MARILVVDDEVNSARLVSMAIGLMGHESVEAYRGDQAVEMINSEKPDLVLLDYMMPGMNGLETLSQIRSIFGDDPPVYMLTAAQDYYVRDQVIERGAKGWFSKPLDLQKLEAILNEAVPVPLR
jgi:DNA-binding response OmpR family regulator